MEQTLALPPGVMPMSTRIFITGEDVMALMGCRKSKAYGIVREVNKLAKEKGSHPFPAGEANKYLFSDIFSIPMEEIDKVIREQEVGKCTAG